MDSTPRAASFQQAGTGVLETAPDGLEDKGAIKFTIDPDNRFTRIPLHCVILLIMRRLLLIVPAAVLLLLPGAVLFAADPDIGGPVTHKNLTLYPLYAEEPAGLPAVITLDEGTAERTVVIEEIEGDDDFLSNVPQEDRLLQRADDPEEEQIFQQEVPREQIQQTQGTGSRVNTLAVTNRSRKPLLLVAGEIIKGGKQNRTVSRDLIIPPGAEQLALDVFCVEQGRWTEDPLLGSKFTGGENLTAQNSLRKTIISRGSQGAVWEQVAEINRVQGNETEAQNYLENLEASKQAEAVEEYAAKILPYLKDGRTAGVLAVVNGKIAGMDLFFSPNLFMRRAEKIVAAYALDAVMDPAAVESPGGGDPRTPEAIVRFVETALRAGRIEESITESYRHFYLEDRRSVGTLLQIKGPRGWLDIHLTLLPGE